MDDESTARTGKVPWRARSRAVAVTTALVLGALPAGTAAARGPSTVVVHPG